MYFLPAPGVERGLERRASAECFRRRPVRRNRAAPAAPPAGERDAHGAPRTRWVRRQAPPLPRVCAEPVAAGSRLHRQPAGTAPRAGREGRRGRGRRAPARRAPARARWVLATVARRMRVRVPGLPPSPLAARASGLKATLRLRLERCPSGRRSATGNRVRAERCVAGSNPALSVDVGATVAVASTFSALPLRGCR
jgi:hypothetical protein